MRLAVVASILALLAAVAFAGAGPGNTVLLGRRSRWSHCHRGAEPDRRCTPGAIYAGLTRQELCAAAFHTSSIRRVTYRERYAVEREYGMVARHYGLALEIDHVVPLELGGSNDIANLWPEPGSGRESYHAKDRLENRLHAMVCAGKISLHAAQVGIARDWRREYRRVYGRAP